MKKLLLTLTCVSIIMLIGCAGSKQSVPMEVKNIPTFDFTPPTTTQVDTNSVVFAVVNPQFPDEWKEYRKEAPYPFNKFSKNMAKDFDEILSARGFRVRGTFRNYDELTYPDKSESDLILMPIMEIEVVPMGQATSGKDIFGTPKYGWKGEIRLGGRITIKINESLSNEKMWTKSIELDAVSFNYEVKSLKSPVSRPSFSDAKLYNILAEHLQNYYTQTMDKIWVYLDPNEMAMVRKQALELKAKKRY